MIAEIFERVDTLDPKAVGRVLRSFRDRLGLTQTEVGQRLNLSEQGYAHYENGRVKRFAVSDVARFAVALGITAQELMEALELQEPPGEEPTIEVIVRGIRGTADLSEEDKVWLIRMVERSRVIAQGKPDPGQ